MPNLVRNRIIVHGSEQSIKFFVSKMEVRNDKYHFELGQLVPVDPENPPMFCEHEVIDETACWGTKWGLNAIVSEVTDTRVSISILTAWEPPLDWAINAADCCSANIDVHYIEESDFYGSFYTASVRDNRKLYTETCCLKCGEDEERQLDYYYPIGELKTFAEKWDIDVNS